MRKGLSNHAGFSLVELMVAMIIGLFLTLGVFTMFSMSSSNVTTTSQFNQLQENGRIALALMERDISQLGFMGDITGTELVRGVNTTLLAAIIPTGDDCIGGGINNASFPNTTSSHFRKLWGYEAGVGTESLACLTNVVKNTDVIQIKRLSGPPTTNPNDVNRYYIGATANQAIIFSGSQPTPTLDNGRFWEYVHRVYYIQNDGSIPVLRRRLLLNGGMNTSGSYEQLVEGIENMRILYGFDNDENSTMKERAVKGCASKTVKELQWKFFPCRLLCIHDGDTRTKCTSVLRIRILYFEHARSNLSTLPLLLQNNTPYS